MVKTENFTKVEVSSTAQLRAWLTQYHTQKETVWLVTHKKHIADKYISVSEILDQLLCFGWIDGLRRKLDEDRTMQLISPRQVQRWTKTYKDRFAELEKLGLVTEAGKKSVAVAKQNGLWDFMDDVDQLIKPAELLQLLQDNPPALQNFDAINTSSKRFALRYIKIAKTPATRTKRMLEIMQLAKAGKKLKGS